MKKIYKGGYMITAILIIAIIGGIKGGGKVTDKTLKKIHYGMKQMEVVKILGEPTTKITKKREVDAVFNEDLTQVVADLNDEHTSEIKEFYDEKDQRDILNRISEIDNSTKVTVYQYTYTKNHKKKVKNIYLSSDKTFFKAFD